MGSGDETKGTRGRGGRKRKDGGRARGEEGCGRGPRHALNSEGTTIKPLVSVSMQPCITFPHQEIKVGPTHQAVVPDHPAFPPYAKGKPQDDLL